MPRQKSLITVIRDLVQQEVRSAVAGLLAGLTGAPANGRRRRRRKAGRKWRPGGPGRPPKAVAAKATVSKRARKKK